MVDRPKYTMIPVFLDDHKKIKDVAAARKISIVNLVREWVERGCK